MELRTNRLYGVFKEETQLSDCVCPACMDLMLKEHPLDQGEVIQEITPSWEERYGCTHCGESLGEWYEKEGELYEINGI